MGCGYPDGFVPAASLPGRWTPADVGGLWAGVRERVEVLAGRRGATKIFGACDHGFALAAPLTEQQLHDWEARAGVTLPIEYRSFLTEVAAAGAGPYYGLLGFEVTDGIARWVGEHWRGQEELNLRTVFPTGTRSSRSCPTRCPNSRQGSSTPTAPSRWPTMAAATTTCSWSTARTRATSGSTAEPPTVPSLHRQTTTAASRSTAGT